MVTITAVPGDDEQLFRDWYRTMRRALSHERPHAVCIPFDQLRNTLRNPPAHARRIFLVAIDDGQVIGGADLTLETQVNLDRAELEIGVLPEHRGRGVAAKIFAEIERRCSTDGRTTLAGELHGTPGQDSPGLHFATRRGFTVANQEHHLVLTIPMPPDRHQHLETIAATASEDYPTTIWTNRCPDDLVEPYCRMREQMDSDVPIGELTIERRSWNPERLRTSDARRAPFYEVVTAAARRSDTAELVGYSELLIPRNEPDLLWQEETLVMPGHRGHRIGLALKLATYDHLRAQHPDRTVIHTWTELNNQPMLRTNDRFGYQIADRLYEVQRVG